MAGAKRAESRLSEVKELLELMKAQGLSTLRVGDIELTVAQSAPVERLTDEDVPRPKLLSAEEREREENARRRRISLGAGSRIVSRVGE